MDPEIATSISNLNAMEAKYGKWTLPPPTDDVQIESDVSVETDANSDPICSSAGCDQYKHKHKKLPYPVDYPVPNNGVDHDILANDNSLKVAEGIVGKKWDFKLQKPPVNPAKKTIYDGAPKLDGDIVDSRTNLKSTETKMSHKLVLDADDLQVGEQINSDPICSSAGCGQYKHAHKKLPYPVDYPVPDNGMDHDIVANDASLKAAEGIVGKKWDFKMQKPPINPAKKVLYDDGPKLDGDIVDSRTNLKNTETKQKHKLVLDHDDLQVESTLESDPICSSAGCTQYKHKHKKLPYPIDYPVPNFGVDRDIVDNDVDLKVAEGITGHHWNFELLKPPVNPAKKTIYNGAPKLDEDIIDSRVNLKSTETKLNHKFVLDSDDVQLDAKVNVDAEVESDPICSSAGCVQYLHKHKKLPYPINYPVPNFGVDRDIIDNGVDLKVAEGITGHHWDFELLKPPVNPAKKTIYDGAPKLDEDIIDSRKNLKATETKLNHKFVLDSDDVQLDAEIKTE